METIRCMRGKMKKNQNCEKRFPCLQHRHRYNVLTMFVNFARTHKRLPRSSELMIFFELSVARDAYENYIEITIFVVMKPR